jgi:hypothetical protein
MRAYSMDERDVDLRLIGYSFSECFAAFSPEYKERRR